MSNPFAHSSIAGLLLIASLVTGCGGGGSDEASETKPGPFRIVRAIITSLLSNSIEINESSELSELSELNEKEPAAQAAPPDAGRSSQPMAAQEPDAPQTCVVPYTGPVTIVAVRTPTALARSVADRGQVRLVYETEDTAIWEDGRVHTLNVEELGTHLNAVGWASNPMRILGAGTRPGGAAARGGWNAGTSSFKRSAKSNARKRRKRRRG